MRDLRRFIKSNNIIMKAVSLILTVTILASSFVYLGNEKMKNVSAAGELSRTYMEHIVKRLIDGLQDEFNILEIVPYKGQGEFRYYVGKEVKEKLEENQTLLASYYNGQSTNIFSDFSYGVSKNTDTGKYEVTIPELFTSCVMTDYQTLISEVVKVNTVEANDITDEDIKKADLIIINTGTHDSDTIACYKTFTGDNREVLPYIKDAEGNVSVDSSDITYNNYEKVPASEYTEEPDGEAIETGKIYYVNENKWPNVCVYYWGSSLENKVDIPGTTMTHVEGDLYYIEIPSTVEYVGFTNGTVNTNVGPIRVDGFDKVYYGGVWNKYPLILNPSKYTVTMPTDANIVATGDVEAIQGESYTVKFSSTEGYVILDPITVTIGDASYTNFVYDNKTYELTIPSADVTGNIVINATAVKDEELAKYGVTLPTDTNIISNPDVEAVQGKDYKTVISAKEGYKLPDTIEVTIGGVRCEEYTYDKITGDIIILSPLVTGDIVITATAVQSQQLGEEYAYKPRDMSWSMCEKLLDCMINGRNLETPEGIVNLKTPVIINNDGIEGLNKDSNIYKLMYIYRMCGADRWDILKTYLSTADSTGKKYRTTSGLVTPVIKKEATGWDADSIIWEKEQNPITALFNTVTPDGKTPEGAYLSSYYEASPFSKNHLTDNYWVYSNSSWIINGNGSISTEPNSAAFNARVEGDKIAVNVLKYLLGVKSNQIYSFSEKLRVLEIQPCNSFEYDSIEEIKALGRALLRSNVDSWNTNKASSNYYGKYLEINHVTPNELNGIKDDIASNYDVVIIGDNTDILTKGEKRDYRGNILGYETKYNDRNLNGYIYLAFGDLYKISTNMLGFLPDEYIELTDSQAYVTYRGYGTSWVDVIQDADGNKLRNITDQKVWTPYVGSVLASKKSKSGYFIVHDMYEYYAGKKTERYIHDGIANRYLADSSGKINHEAFYMKYYLGNARLPDNDISDITKNKLAEFVKTGNPIIVADSVYRADRTKLYPTSDMYDFAATILRNESGKIHNNVVHENSIGRSVAYLGVKAPEIEFLKGNVDVITRTAEMTATGKYIYKKVSTSDMPLKPVEPTYEGTNGVVKTFNGKKLYYKFKLTGQVNATYKIKLFVDKNNDGVYKEDLSDENKNEVYFAELVTLNNTRSKIYEISSQLSENFRGMLSWKIQVVKLDDNGDDTPYKVEEKGFSAIFRGNENVTPLIIQDSDLKEIRVLQIYPGSTNLDLTSNTFRSLFNNVAESVGYKITVTNVSVRDFNGWYDSENDKYVKNDPNKGYKSTRDRLNNSYEMILFGFYDSFNHNDISNDYGAMDNIMDFIDSGKAVLLTHDTLSWRSTPNYVSGYVDKNNNFTCYNYTGMVGVDDNGNKKDFIYDFKNTSPTLTFMLREKAGMDKYGVTLLPEDREGKEVPMYEAVDSSDTDYRPSYATSDEVREIQGFNSWMLWRVPFVFRHKNNYDDKGKNYFTLRPHSDGKYLYYNSDQDSWWLDTTDNWTSKKAECINEGPVTLYPYHIGAELSVSDTHGQYFELDMEDEEVVVWYTLAQNSSDATDNSQFYGVTDKDAANNYYIYSKGNITYSGAGHGNMSNATTEYKLFINTIVKAIAGSNSKPVIEVINGSYVADGSYIAYVPSSSSASQYELGFVATDPDLVSYATSNKNIDLVGVFIRAEVYWWNPIQNDWELIKEQDYQARNRDGETITTTKLKNGMEQSLPLSNTMLSPSKLEYIEQLVEVDKVGAKFKVVVEDSAEEITSVEITLHVRDLFNMN